MRTVIHISASARWWLATWRLNNRDYVRRREMSVFIIPMRIIELRFPAAD